MPDAASPARTSAFDAFRALDSEARKKILAHTHELYDKKHDAWQIFLDAYEGGGGFESGDYLWKFPREEANDFKERKQQARYHNYVSSLIDLYVRHVFHGGVKRDGKSDDLKAWWENVDGAGTTIDDLMKRAAHMALAMGHDGILVDKTPDAAVGPSKADERGRVVASLFTPLDMKDWRLERDELVSIKLTERVDDPDILSKADERKDACQYLIFSKDDGWARFDEEGDLVMETGGEGMDNPNLGMVPFAVLRPQASVQYPFLGKPLLGNANIIRALFNRHSEEDVVIRDSSWSMLTVSVDKDGDVATVKQEVGTEVGTTRAIIAKGQIEWKGPNQEIPKSVRDSIQYLVQEIYRMAHVTFHRESADAESAEALRLKHTELNEMLLGLAASMTRVEQQIARYYFGWMTTTKDLGDAAMKAAEVSIEYPSEFFIKDLLEELEIWGEGIALDLGLTFTQRMKIKAAKTLDPEMDEATLKKVEEEIKAQKPKPELDPALMDPETIKARAMARLTGKPEPDQKPEPTDA